MALLAKARWRTLLQLQLQWWPWLLLASVLLLRQWSPGWVMLLTLVLLVGLQLICRRARRYRSLGLGNLLLHLNRQNPRLEESAQLILREEKTLPLLQRLQRQKTEAALHALLRTPHPKLLPAIDLAPVLYHGLAAGLLLGLIWLVPWGPSPGPESAHILMPAPVTTPQLDDSEIRIIPPAYTLLEATLGTALDIEVLAGSTVIWRLAISGSAEDYSVYFDDGTVVPLVQQGKAYVSPAHIVQRSGIYSVGRHQGDLPGVYAITLVADLAPSIRIIEPVQSITEFATNATPQLRTVVDVRDDFGISEVSILASIAKGSGEAVKFRDQRFTFDKREVLADRTQFTRQWQLDALDMAPGDELYFTVHVWDNRFPEPQLSRSQTRIVRWLEDSEEGMLSSGVLIDFMPAYFKSQRQIIIDTKQLISDKPLLSANTFASTAKALGQAQRDLKEKYGQYLGAEVEGGGAPVDEQVDEQVDEHVDAQTDEHDHDQDEGTLSPETEDQSGYSQMVAEFGHAHGDADIGIVGHQNPKALMKRAIAEMWQAELQLLLGEPSLALPYENAALRFLNRARKAERIYVKRLGFEPPPVTEQRRYQGELGDILDGQQRQRSDPEDAVLQAEDIRSLLALLTSMQTVDDLNSDQQQQFEAVKRQLVERTVTQPALIEAVAILARLRQGNSNRLVDCVDCVQRLTEILWQLLPAPVAAPVSRRAPYSDQNSAVRHYGTFLAEPLDTVP
jgi:hypothetical protein